MKKEKFNPNLIKIYKIGKTLEDAINSVDVFYSAESAKEQLSEVTEAKEGVMYYYQVKKKLSNGENDCTGRSIRDYEQLINNCKVQVDYFKACKVYELEYGFISGQEVE